jgi:hypothetical protein
VISFIRVLLLVFSVQFAMFLMIVLGLALKDCLLRRN